MAISYQNYRVDAYDDILSALKTAIDGTELFTSATITTESDAKVLTVVKGETTYITVECYTNGPTPEIQISFRRLTLMGITVPDLQYLDNYSVFVGTSGNSVIFSAKEAATMMASAIIMPGKDGSFIIAKNKLTGINPLVFGFESMCEDTPEQGVYTDSFYPITNSKWTSITGIAANSESSNYVRSHLAYRMFSVQTGIPEITSEQATYKKLTIDGFSYLTDGYFCLLDK